MSKPPHPGKVASIRDRNRSVSRRDYLARVNPGELARSECSESDGLTRTLRLRRLTRTLRLRSLRVCSVKFRNFIVHMCENFC